MSNKIIMVAPTGARRTKADHPNIPVTTQEIVACAERCAAAGANAFHLHVRNDDQSHSISSALYRDAISAIRERCPDLPIQCTTEAAGTFSVDEQIASVKDLIPDWISYSLAELWRDGEIKAMEFLKWAQQNGVRVQFILYSVEDIAHYAALRNSDHKDIISKEIIIVAGRYGQENDRSLPVFEALYEALTLYDLPPKTDWMTCAFGVEELACLQRSLTLGGHARIGFENSITNDKGDLLKSNESRVSELISLIEN